jgi:hypothetical protein
MEDVYLSVDPPLPLGSDTANNSQLGLLCLEQPKNKNVALVESKIIPHVQTGMLTPLYNE